MNKGGTYEKTLKIKGLDCADCTAKMEDAIKKVEGVQEVSVNFMTQKLKLEINDENYGTIIKEIRKVCKKVEPDCTILDK